MGKLDPNRRRRAGLALLTAAATTAAMAAATPAHASVTDAATGAATAAHAPAIRSAGSATAIPGSYIVVLKAGAPAAAASRAMTLSKRYGGTVDRVYSAALQGYAARMTPRAAGQLAADPLVAYVSQNQRVHALDTQANPPSWGLDRIDQRNQPMDQTYRYSATGAGVNAYIIDTGIRATHQDLGGRVRQGIDTIDNDNDAADCAGHGTHVAGTVGGKTYGVAKAVTLWAVRVLDCDGSGTSESVIGGIDWVTAHAVKPAVANMSLGGEVDQPLDDAVSGSIASGVTYGIAAGNSRIDACDFSPARVPNALTVGATYLDDSRAGFSNFGPCVDIFAPGVGITSAWLGSDTDTNTISGTSMAAPHVTGTAALYLEKNPTATPQQVTSALLAAATPGKVTDPGTGSPNLLLYTDHGIPDPAPVPGCGTKTNGNDVRIPDAGVAVGTAVRVAGCAGNAPANLGVEVHITHSFRGDLRISLVGPSGKTYLLKNSDGDGAPNVNQTFRVNASAETNNGTWVLEVQDRSEGDVGVLDSWSLHLPNLR